MVCGFAILVVAALVAWLRSGGRTLEVSTLRALRLTTFAGLTVVFVSPVVKTATVLSGVDPSKREALLHDGLICSLPSVAFGVAALAALWFVLRDSPRR